MEHPPLPYAFVKEQINRQNRLFAVQNDVYNPNLKKIPVTGKFWAKHESGSVKAEQESQHARYMEMVEEHLIGVPKQRYERPLLESHNYGWLIEPFIKYDDKDKKLFRHPKPRYEITQVGEKIFAEKVTERPKYMGVPFKLR